MVDWVQEGNIYLKSFAIFCLIFPPIFPQLDVRSRFQNYKQVKDHFYQYGFQKRIVNPFAHSKCQRDAVIAAAEELGFAQECKKHFDQLGYKWYHVIPDMLVKRPTYLLHKMFWLNTFFVKTYHSKIDYKKLQQHKKSFNLFTVKAIKTSI